jgi:outer membrane immunogenic protein
MRPVILRLVTCGLVVLGWAGTATAQVPILRGSDTFEVSSPRYRDWSGFYVGGQAGYHSATIDFSDGVKSLMRYAVRNSILENHILDWAVLPKKAINNFGFGAFVGYNWQWENAVLGFELNYNRVSLKQTASDTISRSFTDNSNAPDGHTYTYNITVDGASSIHITDIATARARGGWVMGAFMPYGFAGVAVGRANVSRSVNIGGTLDDSYTVSEICGYDGLGGAIFCDVPVTDTYNLIIPSQSESQKGVFAYGFTAGLGLDFAVSQQLFVRAEWEYVQFAPVKDISVAVSTGRVGVGLKF